MAETKGTGGEAATNTRTSSVSGTGSTSTSNATGNTAVTSSADIGGRALGKTAPNADLQDVAPDQNPAKAGNVFEGQLPYPHQGLQGVDVNASIYRNEVEEVLKEHERLKGKAQAFEPSPELMAARAEAQVAIAKELRANLAAQRVAAALRAEDTRNDTVKVKVFGNHTHGTKTYKAGETAMVDEASADFLVLNRLGERV